jgi:hypothetical protein
VGLKSTLRCVILPKWDNLPRSMVRNAGKGEVGGTLPLMKCPAMVIPSGGVTRGRLFAATGRIRRSQISISVCGGVLSQMTASRYGKVAVV